MRSPGARGAVLAMAIAAAIAGLGCAGPRRFPAPMPIGTTADLQINAGTSGTWEEAGLRVLFRRVVSDSRCPIGTNCIWAGNAVVELVATRGRRSTSFQLRLGPPAAQAGAVNETEDRFGFRFQVVALEPEPRPDTGPLDPASYGVTVRITSL